MKEEINSRIILAINYIIENKVVGTKKELADSFQISPSKLSEILKNRMHAGIDIFKILFEQYSINPTWLLSDEGDMLLNKGEASLENTEELNSDKQMLQEYVKDLKERIEELKEYKDESKELRSELKEFRKKQEETDRELKIAKEFISQNYLSDYEKFRSKTA